MTAEPTLDLPEATEHGVVYTQGDEPSRSYSVDTSEEATALAANLRRCHPNVVWNDEPHTSGWYGLQKAGNGSITHRTATF